MSNNTIRSNSIEFLINQHLKIQAAEYANNKPNSANSVDATRSGGRVQSVPAVLLSANNIRQFPFGPSDVVAPTRDIVGYDGTNQLGSALASLPAAIYKWSTYYSNIRICRFQQTVSNTYGDQNNVVGVTVPAYDKLCYIPTIASNALVASGITLEDIANVGNLIKGYEIVYSDIEAVIVFMKQQLKNIYEDPSKGTTFNFCHSSCHQNCHSNRNRR